MEWSKNARYWLAIIVLACVVYVPGLSNSFTYLDDHVQVVENPFVRSLNFESIKGIFTTYFVGMYQPVTTIIYAATNTFFGMKPTAFHGLSLLLHIINSLLVFKLLRSFLKSNNLPVVLTAVFVTHPMQVESVAWVSAFSNLLFSFFFLLAFWFYIRYKNEGNIKFWTYCLVLFILSCLSKSAAVIFPIVLFAYDYFSSAKFELKLFFQKIPFLLISLIFGIVTLLGRETAGHLSDLSAAFSSIDRVFLVSNSFLFYPIKFLLPYPLSAFYPYPELTDGHLPSLFYLSPILLIVIALGLFKVRNKKLIIFGSFWFIITIFLVLQFVPFGNQITTDRYIYLPLFGLLLILGSALQKVKESNLLVAAVIPIFILTTTSFQRVQIWQNDQTLWESVIETHPTVSQAYNNLGSFALKQNQSQQAFNYFNQAIQIQPNYADAYSNRGNLYAQAGNSSAAIKDFDTAIRLRPHADAYFNRANEFSNLNRLNEAISDYSESIKLDPRADSYTNRAFAYLKIQKVTLAQQDLKKAQQINPRYARAYFLEGIIEQNIGNKNAACSAFLKAANLGEANARKTYNQNCN